MLDLKPRDHVNFRPLRVSLITYRTTNRVKLRLLHKTLIGHATDYISDLLTPVADMSSRSSLRALSNGNLFLYHGRSGDSATVRCVTAPRAWKRRQHSSIT